MIEFTNQEVKKYDLIHLLEDPKGLCADLKVDITEEDIAQSRQEMWGNFPRDIV